MADTARQRILLIEDDQALSRVLSMLLASSGFDVHSESSGLTAINFAAEHRPDLVILDLRLPDISGYEVCKELRKIYNRWDVPVMMLTGMGQPSDQLRGFAHGADAYLTKPCESTELLGTIALLLGKPVPSEADDDVA